MNGNSTRLRSLAVHDSNHGRMVVGSKALFQLEPPPLPVAKLTMAGGALLATSTVTVTGG